MKGPCCWGRQCRCPRLLRRAAVPPPPLGVRPAPAVRESGRAALPAAGRSALRPPPPNPRPPPAFPGACCRRQRRFTKLVRCFFPDPVNCCRTFLHHPAPGAGGVVSSMCRAGLTAIGGWGTRDTWQLVPTNMATLILPVGPHFLYVSLLQDSSSTSWIHRSYCTWSMDLSIVTLNFWRELLFNIGHLLGCSAVASSPLTKCSPFTGNASISCLSVPSAPRNPFMRPFFSLRSI